MSSTCCYFAVLIGKEKERNKKAFCEKKKVSQNTQEGTSHVHFMFIKLDITCVISELL